MHCTSGDDEKVFAARVCPAPLSEVAGPQERVQRGRGLRARGAEPRRSSAADGSTPAVLEQVIVPPLPEVQFVERVARVRVPAGGRADVGRSAYRTS